MKLEDLMSLLAGCLLFAIAIAFLLMLLAMAAYMAACTSGAISCSD